MSNTPLSTARSILGVLALVALDTVREIATAIAVEFRRKLNVSDDDCLDGIMRDVTAGGLAQRDSRHYRGRAAQCGVHEQLSSFRPAWSAPQPRSAFC